MKLIYIYTNNKKSLVSNIKKKVAEYVQYVNTKLRIKYISQDSNFSQSVGTENQCIQYVNTKLHIKYIVQDSYGTENQYIR